VWPKLRLRPELNDIEPDPYPRTEVPVYFEAWNPGPEPVDDGEGCVAGTREPHTFVEELFLTREDEQRPDDEYVRMRRLQRTDRLREAHDRGLHRVHARAPEPLGRAEAREERRAASN
jgi:hypothetical protein